MTPIIPVVMVASALMVVGFEPADARTVCQAAVGKGAPWSWRMIDGKRCWFKGKSTPKAALVWRKAPRPQPPPVKRAASDDGDDPTPLPTPPPIPATPTRQVVAASVAPMSQLVLLHQTITPLAAVPVQSDPPIVARPVKTVSYQRTADPLPGVNKHYAVAAAGLASLAVVLAILMFISDVSRRMRDDEGNTGANNGRFRDRDLRPVAPRAHSLRTRAAYSGL